MTIENCAHCGGTHIGSNKCPFIEEPCVICGDATVMACSDCAIDSWGRNSVHVCKKRECRERHEITAHAPQENPPNEDEAVSLANSMVAIGLVPVIIRGPARWKWALGKARELVAHQKLRATSGALIGGVVHGDPRAIQKAMRPS